MEESYVVGASPPLLPPPLMPVEATLPEPASEGRPASTAHRNESKSSAQRSDAAAEVPSTVEAVAGKRAAEVVEETLPAKRRHTDSRGTRITLTRIENGWAVPRARERADVPAGKMSSEDTLSTAGADSAIYQAPDDLLQLNPHELSARMPVCPIKNEAVAGGVLPHQLLGTSAVPVDLTGAHGLAVSRSAGWESKLAKLKEYKAAHGDCNVPNVWAEDQQLANWVHNQRNNLRKTSTLDPAVTEARWAKLDAIGFSWSRPAKRRAAADATPAAATLEPPEISMGAAGMARPHGSEREMSWCDNCDSFHREMPHERCLMNVRFGQGRV
jgi:hypothetical protein